MGINISFFKTAKHKVFNYQPLYYDERKEHIDELKKEIEKEKAAKEGKVIENKEYVPGENLRGNLRNAIEHNRKHSLKPSTSKIIAFVTLLIFFVLLIYFAQYFGLFLKLLN